MNVCCKRRVAPYAPHSHVIVRVYASPYYLPTYLLNHTYPPACSCTRCPHAGAMWAVGQLMYFYSNEHLEYVVSFPLMQLGPGVIGAFYGVFYFKEVKGAQNLALLGLVFFLAILAALMIVWSRV